LDRLDHYARCAADYTERRKEDYFSRPGYYDDSEAKFRIVMMVSVLRKVFGVRYHPDKIPDDVPHAPPDVFIHGPLVGEGGTCASLPVVFTAVGRRLDYPIRLVSCKGHLFCRWDGDGERFNIEVNETGTDAPSDDYYRTGKFFTSPWKEEHFCFLQSQTPRMEMAGFLAQRAYQWLDLGEYRQGLEAFAYSCRLTPANKSYEDCLRGYLLKWRERLDGLVPPHFPALQVHYRRRRYPWLSELLEREMVCFEATERVLAEPKHAAWWDELRRSPESRPWHVPSGIELCVEDL
jgi:hypothetical protein